MDILNSKKFKSYLKISRYSQVPYYYNTEDNKFIYGTGKHLATTTAYTIHIVQRGDTPDSIALLYYNNPTYFWIILDFNRILDPFSKLIEGSYIKVPTLSLIKFEEQ